MRFVSPIALFAVVAVTPAVAQSGQNERAVRTVEEALEAISSHSPAAAEGAAAPVPTSNPGDWITPEDYPKWAVANGVTGVVAFRVEVDAEGKVRHCEITESSGIGDLDRTACEKVAERGTFRPAHDEEGRPTSGTWSSRVVWQIPPGPRPLPEPGYLVVNWVVEADGSVSDCQVERAEGAADKRLSDICDSRPRYAPPVGEDGKPQRRRMRVMMRVVQEPLP